MTNRTYKLTNLDIMFNVDGKNVRVGGIQSVSVDVAWENALVGEAGSSKNVAHSHGIMAVTGTAEVVDLDYSKLANLVDLESGENPEFNFTAVSTLSSRPVSVKIVSAVFSGLSWNTSLTEDAKETIPFNALDFKLEE